MQALKTGSQTFQKDQRLTRSVKYWDTTQTVTERGVSCALFDVLNPSYNLLADSTRAAIEASLAGASFRSVLGYSGSAYQTGVLSNLYLYWGAGSPTGGQTARRVGFKFFGTITGAGATPQNTILVLGGQGKVQVYHTRGGTTTKLRSGTVQEPVPHPMLTSLSATERDGGYLIIDASLQDGDVLEIYYVQNGERWGGFFAKAIPGESAQFVSGGVWSWPEFRSALESAAYVGSSLLSAGAATEQDIEYVERGVLHGQVGAITTLELDVPLTESSEPDGYTLDESTGQARLVNNRTSAEIRPHRRVYVEQGFLADETETYPRFTGIIDQIIPSQDLSTATIHCRSFESRIESQFDENFPDLLSYHSHGYIDREWKGFPVWGVPAFDAWPLEAAVEDLLSRAGVDSYNLGRSAFEVAPSYGLRQLVKATTGEVVSGSPLFQVRSLANSSERVYLQRKGNYGNVGLLKKEYLPPDEAYLYPAELTDRLFDRALGLADQYGYDLYFDASGQAVLGSRNNGTTFEFLSTPEVDEAVNPSAVGGKHLRLTEAETTATPWTKVISGNFSRLDLFTGIGSSEDLNGGLLGITVDVKVSDAWVSVPAASTTISTYSELSERFFYDYAVREDGTNGTVFTILQQPFDEYRVTITPLGPDAADVGATDCLYRLNGVATFDRDPMASPYPVRLSTSENAISLQPESREEDQRNKVIVIGSRKAAITDSEKLREGENPNNPLPEFFVHVATDPASVYQESAENFTGVTRTSLIVDDKVTDGDFAAWLSRYVLYRERAPRLSAKMQHTAIPVLELRDPFWIDAPRAPDSFPHLLWVQEFTETWDTGEASVDIVFSSEPEVPSYTPREDVDISQFGNQPVTNLAISYQNLYGTSVSNNDLVLSAVDVLPVAAGVVTATAGPQPLEEGAIPETVTLVKATTSGASEPKVNHPYQHYFHVSGWTGTAPTLTYDFQAGDGTAGVYDATFHQFPSGGDTTWAVRYQKLQARTGENPFYDPYTSELGNLVSVSMDALVSGFYRVSMWAAPEQGDLDFPVAWLTSPETDPLNEDAHWAYLESGVGKEWLWDGVDNIGLYNRLQSQGLARILRGAFGENPTAVGAGFYAWNDITTDLHTQIGDLVGGNLGTFTCPITGVTETRFHYSLGRYARFYVKVEVRSDVLLRTTGSTTPLELNTGQKVVDSAGRVVKNANGYADPLFVWSHLGEPTQVWVEPYEWNADLNSAGAWTETNSADGWEKLDDHTAVHEYAQISTTKPVKLVFKMVPRPGPAFAGNRNFQSVQLRPQAHLKATIFDQFWTFFGHPWEDVHKDNVPFKNELNQEEQRVTSRMYHNNEHTLEFGSEAWRLGDQVDAYEFVFEPSQFRKDFGLGVVEAIRYGEFEQLETIPSHDPASGSGTARSARAYLTYAYINYLFFLSAHTMDRSGRRQWCINPGFQDRSKIVSPGWLTPGANLQYYQARYETLSADRYISRSVFARQWVEPGWADGSYANSPVDRYAISDAHELLFVQPEVRDFSPHRSTLADPTSRSDRKDPWLEAYATDHSTVNQSMGAYTIPTITSVPSLYLLPKQFGSWGFERGSNPSVAFLPCPSRDFHPYWSRVMPDWIAWRPGELYSEVSVLAAPAATLASPTKAGFRDVLGEENWFGYAVAQWGQPSALGQGATLEISTQALLKDHKITPINTLFDYVRQDTLDRFDQFRGVLSRAPFQSRKSQEPKWTDKDQQRAAATQPVSPSGSAYLLNVGHYEDYFVGPIHERQPDQIVHQTSGVSDWFDIRFRYEALWQNDQYFPTWDYGGNKYWNFRSEYTNATRIPIVPEEDARKAKPRAESIFGGAYDAGAWAGHKDDLSSADWSANPYLRWHDVSRGLSAVSGGDPGSTITIQGSTLGHTRKNFLDETVYGDHPRLAVGPEVPEARRLVMNLTLPERLAQ